MKLEKLFNFRFENKIRRQKCIEFEKGFVFKTNIRSCFDLCVRIHGPHLVLTLSCMCDQRAKLSIHTLTHTCTQRVNSLSGLFFLLYFKSLKSNCQTAACGRRACIECMYHAIYRRSVERRWFQYLQNSRCLQTPCFVRYECEELCELCVVIVHSVAQCFVFFLIFLQWQWVDCYVLKLKCIWVYLTKRKRKKGIVFFPLRSMCLFLWSKWTIRICDSSSKSRNNNNKY